MAARLSWFCGTLLSTLLLLAATASGQTPPEYHLHCEHKLSVAYHGEAIEPGQVLQPSDTQSIPQLSLPTAKLFDHFTVVMVDMAVNHGGTLTTMLHWIQPGLHLHASSGALLNITDAGGVPYVGPQPNPGPKHSYVFLLFQQPAPFRFPACFAEVRPPTVPARGGFDIDRFARAAGLRNLVAATWFRAGSHQHDGCDPPPITSVSLHVPACESTGR